MFFFNFKTLTSISSSLSFKTLEWLKATQK